jgi:hypothetical protein
MNKERYNQIVDEVYKNYVDKLSYNENDCFADEDINKPNKTFIPYNQEEFINKIKTDKLFSERWGLKIEERGLRKDERHKLLTQQISKLRAIRDEDYIEYNIPTKLITVTHNNETVEIYE